MWPVCSGVPGSAEPSFKAIPSVTLVQPVCTWLKRGSGTPRGAHVNQSRTRLHSSECAPRGRRRSGGHPQGWRPRPVRRPASRAAAAPGKLSGLGLESGSGPGWGHVTAGVRHVTAILSVQQPAEASQCLEYAQEQSVCDHRAVLSFLDNLIVIVTWWVHAAGQLGSISGFKLGLQTSASSARVAGSASRAAAAHCGSDAVMATRPTASFLATDRATECTRVSLLRSGRLQCRVRFMVRVRVRVRDCVQIGHVRPRLMAGARAMVDETICACWNAYEHQTSNGHL